MLKGIKLILFGLAILNTEYQTEQVFKKCLKVADFLPKKVIC